MEEEMTLENKINRLIDYINYVDYTLERKNILPTEKKEMWSETLEKLRVLIPTAETYAIATLYTDVLDNITSLIDTEMQHHEEIQRELSNKKKNNRFDFGELNLIDL